MNLGDLDVCRPELPKSSSSCMKAMPSGTTVREMKPAAEELAEIVDSFVHRFCRCAARADACRYPRRVRTRSACTFLIR